MPRTNMLPLTLKYNALQSGTMGQPFLAPVPTNMGRPTILAFVLVTRAAALSCTYDDVSCSDLSAGAIRTTRSAGGASPAWFNVSVSKAGGTCGLHWTCTQSVWPHLKKRGTSRATASTDASASFRIASAGAGPRRWPAVEATAACDAHVTVSDLVITGAGIVPGAVKRTVEAKIASTIEAKTCEEARALVYNFSAVDGAVNVCDANARASEAAIRRHGPADDGTGPVAWRRTAAVRAASAFAAREAEAELRRLGVVDAAVGVSRTFSSPAANVTVTVDAVRVAGLDAATVELDALPNLTVALAAAAPTVNLTAFLTVTVVSPYLAAPKTEKATATWRLGGATVAGTYRVALRPSAVAEAAFARYPLRCASSALSSLNVSRLSVRADTYARVAVAPDEPSPLVAEVAAAATDAVDAFLDGFPGLVDGALDCAVDGAAKALLNERVAAFLAGDRGGGACARAAAVEGGFDGTTTAYALSVPFVFAVIVLTLGLYAVCGAAMLVRRGPADGGGLAEGLLARDHDALSLSAASSPVAKRAVPSVLVGIVALLFYSYVAPLQRLDVRVAVTSGAWASPLRVSLDNFWTFDAVAVCLDVWNSGATALIPYATLASFLWPLLKLFLSAFAWAAPAAPTPLTPDARFARLRRACHLAPAARVDLLDVLDKLGKWGAVHPIACLVFVALNHLELAARLADPAGGAPDALSATTYLVLLSAFYAYAAALVASQLLGRRLLVDARTALLRDDDDALDGPRAGSCSIGDVDDRSVLSVGLDAGPRLDGLPPNAAPLEIRDVDSDVGGAARASVAAGSAPWVRGAVAVAIFATALIAAAGAARVAFVVTIRGLSTRLMDAAESTQRRSLATLAGGLSGGFEDPHGFAAGFVAAAFALSTIALPPLLCVGGLVLWLARLSLKYQARLLDALELVHAYATLDVFAVTMLFVVAEYGNFAEYAFAQECAELQKVLDAAKSHEICFHLAGSLEDGAALLLVAGLLTGCGGGLALRAARRSVDRRRRLEPAPAFVDGWRWWALSGCLRHCC